MVKEPDIDGEWERLAKALFNKRPAEVDTTLKLTFALGARWAISESQRIDLDYSVKELINDDEYRQLTEKLMSEVESSIEKIVAIKSAIAKAASNAQDQSKN